MSGAGHTSGHELGRRAGAELRAHLRSQAELALKGTNVPLLSVLCHRTANRSYYQPQRLISTPHLRN